MSDLGSLEWAVARSGGFVAYGLLSVCVILGLALSLRWTSQRWPRLVTHEMHGYTSLVALIFTLIHGAAVWVDPFTRFSWSEVWLPFVSHYRPLWVGLGIVSFYLGLAVGASVLVRRRIGYALWRRIHVVAFAVYVLATAHGIATGSDTQTLWGLAIYALSVLAVGGLLCARFLQRHGAIAPRPLWAGLVVVCLALGALGTAAGPLKPGWNAIANNGHGNGARTGSASTGADPSATAARPPDPFLQPFTAALSGSIDVVDAGYGAPGLHLVTRLQGGPAGRLDLLLLGRASRRGFVPTQGRILLGEDGKPRYSGEIEGIDDGEIRAELSPADGSNTGRLQVEIQIQSADANRVQGVVRVEPLGHAE
ncbi:MAG TPA: ferric reductase-like transmembrane domain-containing protein [Limnochordia bacterium]|nr:ferric reductase-like transmembrane domain-containing protein [Limnochordia bacterium]